MSDLTSTFDLSSVVLPKWPALLVVGDKISMDDAAVLIVRTQDFYWFTNNRIGAKSFLEAANITEYDDWGTPRAEILSGKTR